MVQVVFFFGRGRFVTIFDDRMQLDEAHPRNPFFVLRHVAHRFVAVGIHLKTAAGGEIQKCEHVAARNGRDERFFGIDIRRIGMRCGNDRRGRGGWYGKTSVEGPGVFAGVFSVDEVTSGKTPFDDCLVVGHDDFVTFSVSFGGFPNLGRVRVGPIHELAIERQAMRSLLVVSDDLDRARAIFQHALHEPRAFFGPIHMRCIDGDTANGGGEHHIDELAAREGESMQSFRRRPICVLVVDHDVVRRRWTKSELLWRRLRDRRGPNAAVRDGPIKDILARIGEKSQDRRRRRKERHGQGQYEVGITNAGECGPINSVRKSRNAAARLIVGIGRLGGAIETHAQRALRARNVDAVDIHVQRVYETWAHADDDGGATSNGDLPNLAL